MKTCKKCGKEKPDTSYSSNGDGRLRARCKQCSNEDVKKPIHKRYCQVCGIELSGSHRSYCTEHANGYTKKARTPAKEVKAVPDPVLVHLCKRHDCQYYGTTTGTCDYRLFTGQGRGCHGGDLCTRYFMRTERRTTRETALTHEFMGVGVGEWL